MAKRKSTPDPTLATCHRLCRCTCGDYYVVHTSNGLVSEFEPESHDIDCDHYEATLRSLVVPTKRGHYA